jgi:2-polyprenyl-3-methyl-5-hydroxy-6-metoxy-1,4-benzoquinol methylase
MQTLSILTPPLEVPAPRATSPICGGPGARYCTLPPATYYDCPVCATVFQSPMPTLEQMRDYVNAEYASGVYADYVSAAALKSLTFSRRAAKIRARTGTGRLLDVGASCGYFIDEALKAGFDAYGVELSAEAVASAPPALRERLTLGDVNALTARGETPYAVVTAFDIIEHTFDPIAFLQSLRSVAQPGATVVITTPDTGHALRYLLRSRWPMLQPMQHTVLFSRRSLLLALTRAGLEDVRITVARKTLTADYLAGQVEMYLPLPVRAYRAAARVLPERITKAPVSINIGELMAFARVPQTKS